ncbi:hypothetical protein [Rugosimonospora africana]|uniref:Uncharacterized protein n=1 Tax=Rugosimonospora africana TaxID=556532 RepID=A0A8J3VNS8_9ACTN|nr:hypothetical protein [Rugosimonospora africana]GIH12538.1 hypothetical protein Raf01_07100 [Rugosimonospora africana]
MTNIEDELRALFAERAAGVPVRGDPAERVIRRAARLRRRRNTLFGLVGVAVMVLGGASFQVVREHGRATAAQAVVRAASTYPAIKLDLRVGNELWTTDGRRLRLPGVGAVTWVDRVPAGWVYGGTGGSLRLLAPDGTEVGSWLPADAATVSPDGEEVASVSDANGSRVLVIGRLGAAGVDLVAETTIADRAVPVAFVGPSVVLGRADSTGRISAYDFWDPPAAYRPSWNDRIADVYGATGSRLVGLVSQAPGSTDGCVSYLDLDRRTGLRPAHIGACGLGLPAAAAQAAPSPSGRWLANRTGIGIAFIDLDSPDPSRPSASCVVRGRSAPVWEDDSAVLVATDTGLVRCGPDGQNHEIMVSGLPAGDWDVVPALGR